MTYSIFFASVARPKRFSGVSFLNTPFSWILLFIVVVLCAVADLFFDSSGGPLQGSDDSSLAFEQLVATVSADSVLLDNFFIHVQSAVIRCARDDEPIPNSSDRGFDSLVRDMMLGCRLPTTVEDLTALMNVCNGGSGELRKFACAVLDQVVRDMPLAALEHYDFEKRIDLVHNFISENFPKELVSMQFRHDNNPPDLVVLFPKAVLDVFSFKENRECRNMIVFQESLQNATLFLDSKALYGVREPWHIVLSEMYLHLCKDEFYRHWR